MNTDILFENARIAFRNFSGKEGKFNPAGRRNFCLMLSPEIAKEMREAGWNIKTLRPRDPEDDPQDYIQVTVSFAHLPPKVVSITSKNRVTLDERSIDILDWAEIMQVDLVIRAYDWNVSGKSGRKAYLKSIYVTHVEDLLEEKYRQVPDSISDSVEDGD